MVPYARGVSSIVKVYIVRVLIKNGANVNGVDNDGNTTLHLSCRMHQDVLAEELINLGANVNIKNKRGNTPLLEVPDRYHYHSPIEIIKKLILAGADVNALNNKGETVLDILSNSDKRAIEEFISSIPDVKEPDLETYSLKKR